MRSHLVYMLWICIALGVLMLFQQLEILHLFRPTTVDPVGEIIKTCSHIPDTSKEKLPMLADILGIPGDRDEFGQMSRYPSPASVIGKLIKDGKFGNSTAPPFYAVNFGARDGKGTGGNTDPTWDLFHKLGFHGLAVEADGVFWTDLNANLKNYPVKAMLTSITPDNAVSIIKEKGLPRVDVFKIDIDSWDCSVLPPVLSAFHPAVAIVEYNLYFPPPIKMMLDMPITVYNHQKRSKIYECSLQYQTEDVMQPAGYSLAQVDWQNALYLRNDVAKAIGLEGGVDIQAAYTQGYVLQPERNKHIPWATDVLHFIDLRDYGKMMSAVLAWFNTPKLDDRQKGAAMVGCGSKLVPLREI